MAETVQVAKKGKKLYIVIAVVVIAVVLGVFLYWFFTGPQDIPWLFKGAYAKYHGETSIIFATVKFDVRLEVVDYNSTHAKLLMYMKVELPFGSQEFQNVTWSDLRQKSFDVEGQNLKRTYEQEVFIEGFGTRKCIIYEYESKTAPGSLTTFYVDKSTSWPVKMKFSSTQDTLSMSVDLNLTETNIPGLKK